MFIYGSPISGADSGGGGGGRGALGARLPPKIGKKYYFLALNRDFSHEIPQKCSCLPPQLEKI